MPAEASTARLAGQDLRGAERPAGSHAQLLLASAIVGGASLLNVAVGIVRTKLLAVMLGPAGVGLMGLYGAIADMTRSVAEMGINGSGVRQIAQAQGSGDAQRVAITVGVLRRVAVYLGLLGAALLLVLAEPVARFTFGDSGHAGAVALLSLVVLLRLVGDGQAVLLQAMRRVGDLARASVCGGLLGTLATLGLIALMGERGIVPSLVAATAAGLLASWWYSRRVPVLSVLITGPVLRHEVSALLRLGMAFMASGLLMLAAGYAARLIVARDAGGPAAAGLYQAAWTLGGLYVSFILQAMGTDFYPRLVGVIGDHPASNQLVNEQTQVSLWLAGPGVLATMTFAAWVLSLLYSAEFAGAVELLRWICAGMALRVITWPMGFIVVAKGRQRVFFATELGWTLANIGLTWWCVGRFGLSGAGMAFFGAYVLHALVLYPLVHRLSGFRWTAASWRSGAVFLLPLLLVFTGFLALPARQALWLGAGMTLLTGAGSLYALLRLLPAQRLPRRVRQLLRRSPPAA